MHKTIMNTLAYRVFVRFYFCALIWLTHGIRNVRPAPRSAPR